MDITGGVNGGLIWTGVIGIAGGIVGCCVPGRQVCGGIAIYGGVIGALITAVVFCKKKTRFRRAH